VPGGKIENGRSWKGISEKGLPAVWTVARIGRQGVFLGTAKGP
jgi:hypothetical protein